MSSRVIRLGLCLVVTMMTSCGEGGITGIKRDYQTPVGAVATINVRSASNDSSERVIVHGARVCDVEDARLVGLLNSAVVDVKKVSHITFEAAAGKTLSLSIPSGVVTGTTSSTVGTVTTTTKAVQLCQPVLQFAPEAGKVYEVQFSGYPSCTASVKESGNSSQVQFSLFKNCAFREAPDPRKPTYGFWLRESAK
jgi:hypothetical protein